MSEKGTLPFNYCNPNAPINPIDPRGAIDIGLTKREYFAAKALQGIFSGLSGAADIAWSEEYANRAVEFADALIERLNKNKEPLPTAPDNLK